MASTVVAGDYQYQQITNNPRIGLSLATSMSWKKCVPINKETVERYEVIESEEQPSAISAVTRGVVGSALFGPAGLAAALSAKKKGRYTVAVVFKDGKRSLMELDDGLYKLLQRTLF